MAINQHSHCYGSCVVPVHLFFNLKAVYFIKCKRHDNFFAFLSYLLILIRIMTNLVVDYHSRTPGVQLSQDIKYLEFHSSPGFLR